MVYTVTFNPAIDYVVRMDEMKAGEVNRTSSEDMYFGGKGINVSVVLKELGITSRALGFTAGFTGEAIEQGVAAGTEGTVTLTVKVLEGALESKGGKGKVVNGGETATVKVGNDSEYTLNTVENPVPENPEKKETSPQEGNGLRWRCGGRVGQNNAV